LSRFGTSSCCNPNDKIGEQEATIAELKSTVAQQQKSFQSNFAEQEMQIKALASGLQKVSAQFATANPSYSGLASRNRKQMKAKAKERETKL
jgi:uncharacterized coiled-coil protein SlyX